MKQIGPCISCRHFFKPVPDTYALHPTVGQCANAKVWYGPEHSRIFIEDNGTYIANVPVGEDFGCVHFEVKP